MDFDELVANGKVKRIFRAKHKITIPGVVSPMRDLFSRYAMRFNRKYMRKGHLFGGLPDTPENIILIFST